MIATANYGFFNYLSLLLCLWLLDDEQLPGRRPPPPAAASPAPRHQLAYMLAAGLLVPVSLLPFLATVRAPVASRPALRRLRQTLGTLRWINAYHVFATITQVRREAVIEGSADGTTWQAYEWRWKPGDPQRAPVFVAPHQPRVDFQMWFLLLGGRGFPPYVRRLIDALLAGPGPVHTLFSVDPFPDQPPAALRVAVYRYRFSDLPMRAATGAWWTRELEGYSRTFARE